jgi:hypothetical protein
VKERKRDQMKLIARVNVKHGQRKGNDGNVTVLEAAPGEEFNTDAETAKTLIASGSAASPEDYERQTRADKPAEERIAELEAEKETLSQENADLKAALEKATKK